MAGLGVVLPERGLSNQVAGQTSQSAVFEQELADRFPGHIGLVGGGRSQVLEAGIGGRVRVNRQGISGQG